MSGQPKSDNACAYNSGPLQELNDALVNSWVRQLTRESEESVERSRTLSQLPASDDNRNKRRVFHGHYVIVKPTGLPQPKLVAFSQDVAQNLLQLSQDAVQSADFLKFVSGNLVLQETWATPYALSIMGDQYTNNCPFGTGDGYGDGRAIAIGEAHGYELQLKGAGKTPFHRGADGRAVLRSSVREFLASEAMHWLHVPTTRALSLVVSGSETVPRPWYSESHALSIPDFHDPRLAQFPPAQRKAILRQMRHQKADPNVLVQEPCAITCRVSRSFMRIGHFDLFARRATSVLQETKKKASGDSNDTSDDENNNTTPTNYDTTSPQWKELEDLIWHACYREFKAEAYDPYFETENIVAASQKLLDISCQKISTMIGHWIRVGFVQGNFNADNCLVGGYTMDYGPFGWVEEYSPVAAKWTGSGQHYGFLNQPIAGLANYNTLVASLAPVIAFHTEEAEEKITDKWMQRAKVMFQTATNETFRLKLGFLRDNNSITVDNIWKELEPLIRGSRVDWTLFWRQLTYVMKEYPDLDDTNYDDMMTLIFGTPDETVKGEVPRISPLYDAISHELRGMWMDWLKLWREALKESGRTSQNIYEQMSQANPKFVLREWMLVDAYKAANKGNYSVLNKMQELCLKPYDEGSEEQTKRYYRKTPDQAQMSGGIAFMS